MCIFVAANTDVWSCKFEHCGDNFAFVNAQMGESFAVTKSPLQNGNCFPFLQLQKMFQICQSCSGDQCIRIIQTIFFAE